MTRALSIFGVAVVVALAIFNTSTYTLNPGQQVMVFRFNELIHEEQRPGLHFKAPIVDEVRKFGAFVYDYDGDEGTFLALNAEPIVVDYYITYRITNLRVFQEEVAGSIARLEDNLKNVTVTAIQATINNRSQATILAEGREEMRVHVFERLLAVDDIYGVTLVDFRINRVDLPEQTKTEVEASMIQERNAEREDILTNATARSAIIRAEAVRDAAKITDEANQKAQALIGLGTREEIVLKDQGFGIDPDFFTFYKRVEQILEGDGLPSGRFIVSDVDAYLGKFLGFDEALSSAKRQVGVFEPLVDLELSAELQETLTEISLDIPSAP